LADDGFAVGVNGRRDDEQAGDVGRSICDGGGTAGTFYADVTDERRVAGLIAAITGVSR
jgi:NAD(P)-dependent dehydrogenase (short-subunit alcohol dehydrogenase family)